METRLKELEAIAPYLNSLVASEEAIVGYDLFADGLIWSDEVPTNLVESDISLSCLRPVLRYRTSLILACPVAKYLYCWKTAQEFFPDWPGFNPRRSNGALKATYHTLRDRALKQFDELSAKLAHP
jgi:hypothetical protein